MGRRAFVVKIVALLVVLWAAVWGIRHFAESKRATAASVEAKIREAGFEDWSGYSQPPNSAAADRREKHLREIAGMFTRLDLPEREKAQKDHIGEDFFRHLSGSERKEFIDLTVRESMTNIMDKLDKLPPEQRRRLVEQGLEDIRRGKTADDMARAQQLGPEVLDTITTEGMRAYFEKASTDTKLDLAPLMDSMNKVMEGLQEKELMPGLR